MWVEGASNPSAGSTPPATNDPTHMLLDVLLHEQLRDIFAEARMAGRGLNAIRLEEHPPGTEELFGGRGAVVRIETTDGRALLVTPRGIFDQDGGHARERVAFQELVGYDWISEEMERKVALKDEHYDRLFLHLRGARTVVLAHLGDAVYPLMTFLGKVLELRSQKVLRRRMDAPMEELISRCLTAAVEGPFFTDEELEKLFEQERGSLTVVAAMWERMNLASPDLRRTVVSVLEMLLERRARHPEEWERRVGAEPAEVRDALRTFQELVQSSEDLGEAGS